MGDAMFDQREHEALMRLMIHATGYMPDSRRIAHWLQWWNRTGPQMITPHVPGLAPAYARDIKTVARAAKRDGARPTTLGRIEYSYNLENIARAYPLPMMEMNR
jgi:hypothetical protein